MGLGAWNLGLGAWGLGLYSLFCSFEEIMQRYLFFLILFITGIISISLYSQEKKDTLNKWWKNPEDAWYVTVNLGFHLSTYNISREFNYSGEYYNFKGNQPGFGDVNWEWKTIKEKNNNLQDSFKLRVLQYDLLISPVRRIHFGLNYSFNLLDRNNFTEEFFICINGKLEYQHPLFNDEDFYLFGSVTLGNYQSDDFNAGPGRETALAFTAGISKVFWKGFYFRFYFSDANLFYRYYSKSRIFYQEQTDKIDWRFMFFGFDVGRRYKLVPDRD